MADSLRLLVLGGTSFIGRAIAGLALAEGAAVTLFTRGRTGPGLFPQANRLTGDRRRSCCRGNGGRANLSRRLKSRWPMESAERRCAKPF